MSILVLTTGGTIGAMPYDDIRRQPKHKIMPPDGSDTVRRLLEEKYPGKDMRFIAMEPRDSNFIDQPYREQLAGLIAAAKERDILLTHGTDTMLQTAEFLHNQPLLAGKTIIITGSMVALSCGAASDGFANLDYALAQFDAHPEPGVSIVLSDYEDERAQTGWAPRLYPFMPGRYAKAGDPDNMHRYRIRSLETVS